MTEHNAPKPASATLVFYKCSRCGAEDALKLFGGEAPPVVLNCWDCRAGLGLSSQQMVQARLGMFPYTPTIQ